MYFDFLHSESIEDMGYSLSKLEVETGHFDGSSSNHGVASSVHRDRPANYLDHEISQLTKLRSGPHENLSRILLGKKEVPVSTFKMLSAREANISGRGRFSKADCCHVLSKYLPVSGPWIVDQMETRAYVSQFSADGSLFVAGFQGSHIRIYNVERGWKVHKNIHAKSLRWTVTDTSLSPDQRHLVYATMSPIVHIVDVGSAATESVANITEIHDGLLLSADNVDFGIFSVKFSTEGREVVAGSSDDAIYVYDLEANKLSLRISAHNVWDRRCFRAKEKPAGVLMGHLEGITFLDSRGDGRYFISNSKDQSIKLWDIRKMSSHAARNIWFRNYEWDYRWMDYPAQARDVKHPYDQSISTYKGHSVLRTLIHCYFSPEYSTGQRYIYTGSHDACIYIYDLLFLGWRCCQMGIPWKWRSTTPSKKEADQKKAFLLNAICPRRFLGYQRKNTAKRKKM